ncbi:MAG: hypothetical protein R2856_02570 [Caldilineaceae bacterium]
MVVPDDFDATQIQLQAPDLGDLDPPVVQLVLNYENGRLVEAGGIPVEVLAALGSLRWTCPPTSTWCCPASLIRCGWRVRPT